MKVRYVLGLVLLVGAAYFALFGGDYSLLDLYGIRAETEREQVRLAEVRADVERLRARADSLEKDDATIERIARERWGLIVPGERLYRFENGSAPADTAREDDGR